MSTEKRLSPQKQRVNKSKLIKKPTTSLTIVVVILFLIILSISLVYKLFNSKKDTVKKIDNKIIEKISDTVIIPQEEPIAKSAQELLSCQAANLIYKEIDKEDILITFKENKKTIVYRPSVNKIVTVISDIPSCPSSKITVQPEFLENSEESEKLLIEVRNGSGIPGAAQKLADELKIKDFFEGAEFKINNSKKNYQENILVDLSNKNQSEAIDFLTGRLGAETSDRLPGEEFSTNAQILIIIGQNNQ